MNVISPQVALQMALADETCEAKECTGIVATGQWAAPWSMVRLELPDGMPAAQKANGEAASNPFNAARSGEVG
jgi:hypothetical protein